MQIDRPIFIGGPGRSGTTLLLHLLSVHPDVTWFSGWTARFPEHPVFALLSRLNDVDSVEKATRGMRRWPRPAEAYGIWDHYFPGFSTATRDWDEGDIDPDGATGLVRAVRGHLFWQKKARFLTKYTGWPRLRFLRAIFPDARTIYIDRDPRAVACSYMKQRWWFKDLPDAFAAMAPKDRLAFYAAKYMEYFEARRRYSAGHDYLQVHYERLTERPWDTLSGLCDGVGLPASDEYRRRVDSFEIHQGTSDVWRRGMGSDEQAHITDLLRPALVELGYVP